MSDSDRSEDSGGEDAWRFDPDGDDAGDEVPEAPPEDAEDEEGWRFDLDDVGEDGVVRQTIEPGDVTLENAVFVLLGAIAMVLVFVRLWMVLT